MAQVFETFTQIAGEPEVSDVVLRVEAGKQRERLLRQTLMGLGFSAVWGIAAAASKPMMALANVYKVPMVLALSALVALPAVLVMRHLLRIDVKPLDLVSALVASFYRATLLLLGFAPLLGVYAYTTQSVAPILAQISAALALLCGGLALRTELRRIEPITGNLSLLGFAAVVTTALALLQLVSLATPVLTVPTLFGHGIDGVMR